MAVSAPQLKMFDELLVVGLNHAEVPSEDGAGHHIELVPVVRLEKLFEGGIIYGPQAEIFCFPDADGIGVNPERPSDGIVFVLTNESRDRQYGFCRRFVPVNEKEKGLPLCISLISRHPWFQFFENILLVLEEVYQNSGGAVEPVVELLQHLYTLPLPKPGQLLLLSPMGIGQPAPPLLPLQKCADRLLRPVAMDPPLLDMNSRPLLQCLSVPKILFLFASLLCERRIIFTSDSAEKLSACVHAASGLIYPFAWQHLFIPIIPKSLLSYCCAPMPFVIGLPSVYIDEVKEMPLEQVSIVNLDANYADAHLEDVSALPPDLIEALRSRVDRVNENYEKAGVFDKKEVMRAFLSFFIAIFGTYRRYFTVVFGELKFQKESFLQAQTSYKTFLQTFSNSQMFEMFILERENFIKEQKEFEGEFEKQAYIQNVTSKDPPKEASSLLDTKSVMASTRSAATKLWSFFQKEKPVESMTPPPIPKNAFENVPRSPRGSNHGGVHTTQPSSTQPTALAPSPAPAPTAATTGAPPASTPTPIPGATPAPAAAPVSVSPRNSRMVTVQPSKLNTGTLISPRGGRSGSNQLTSSSSSASSTPPVTGALSSAAQAPPQSQPVATYVPPVVPLAAPSVSNSGTTIVPRRRDKPLHESGGSPQERSPHGGEPTAPQQTPSVQSPQASTASLIDFDFDPRAPPPRAVASSSPSLPASALSTSQRISQSRWPTVPPPARPPAGPTIDSGTQTASAQPKTSSNN